MWLVAPRWRLRASGGATSKRSGQQPITSCNEACDRSISQTQHSFCPSRNYSRALITLGHPHEAFQATIATSIELRSLDRPHPHLEEVRGARRRDRARRELEKLERGEAMKFSHSIQFNAVPDWSSFYIAYSNLKKLYALYD